MEKKKRNRRIIPVEEIQRNNLLWPSLDWVTRKMVSLKLLVSIQSIRNYTKDGLLTEYKIGLKQKDIRYKREEVDAAIESGLLEKYQHKTTREFIFRR